MKTYLYLKCSCRKVATFSQVWDKFDSLNPWDLETSILLYNYIEKPKIPAWSRTEDLAHTICGNMGVCKVGKNW